MSLRSIEFHLVEATNNIRRNGLMSISAVTNAAACLFVLGCFVLGWWNLARVHQMLASETRITVFMRGDVDAEETQRIADELKSDLSGIAGGMTVITKDDALRRFLEQNPSFPAEGLRERNPFPTAIEIELADPERYEPVVTAALRYQEVDDVRAGQEILRSLAGLRKLGMQVGVALVVLLGAAALLTISNTIRLTIYARRREIGIMQMVGATQTFIRMPFALEGIFHGVVGAAIGGAVLIIGYINLRAYVQTGTTALQFLDALFSVGTPAELGLCWGGLAAAGCLFGLVGSWLSVTRYLGA
jgi:cell division transport system permease protein